MGTVKVTFTGDKTNLEQAYRDLARQVVQLEQANQRLAAATERANKEGISGLGKKNILLKENLAQLKSMATGWFSVTAAIQAANNEIQKNHELQERSAGTQKTLARVQAELFQGMAGATPAERQEAIAGIRQIARETRFPDEGALTSAVGAAYGVNGGNVQAALEAARQATTVTNVTPQDVANVAKATALVMQTGNLSAEQASAFVATAGDVSPIESLRLRSEHIPAAVASMSGTVKTDRLQSMRESAALFSALSFASSDFEGARSRTAAVAFTTQLEELFTTGMKMSVGGHSFRLKPGEDPGTIEGRIRYLQENPKYAKAFLSGASIGQNYEIPIRELLTEKDSNIAKAFQEFIPKITTEASSFTELQQDLKAGTEELRLAHLSAMRESVKQQAELTDREGARQAEARRILQEGLEASAPYRAAPFGTRHALSWSTSRITQDLNVALGNAPEESAIHLLEQAREQVRVPRRSLLGFAMESPVEPENLQGDQKRIYDLLTKQIELLEELAKANQEMNQRDAAREQRRPAATGLGAEVGRHRER